MNIVNIINKEKYREYENYSERNSIVKLGAGEENLTFKSTISAIKAVLQHDSNEGISNGNFYNIYMDILGRYDDQVRIKYETEYAKYSGNGLDLICTSVAKDQGFIGDKLIVGLEFKKDVLINYLAHQILGNSNSELFPKMDIIRDNLIEWIESKNYKQSRGGKGIGISVQDMAKSLQYNGSDVHILGESLCIYFSIDTYFSNVEFDSGILYFDLSNQVYKTAVNVGAYIDEELYKDNVVSVEAERKKGFTLLKVKRFYNSDHKFVSLKNMFPHSEIQTHVHNGNITGYHVIEKQRIQKQDDNS